MKQISSLRKVLLANNRTYHIVNRSIGGMPIFNSVYEYNRAAKTISYYRFVEPDLRFSWFLELKEENRKHLINQMETTSKPLVEILAWCLMPNHFHLLLKQLVESGISKFMANITNSYAKYFNTKYQRAGHLFQGKFRAVAIESNEQLIHVARYVHINPVTSSLIKKEQLKNYPWNSLPQYLGLSDGFAETKTISDCFSSKKELEKFTFNQISYAQELEKIKHLIIK